MGLAPPFYCKTCPDEKSLDDFSKTPAGNPRGRCKQCIAADKRARYATDPESYKAQTREWQQENPEKVRVYEKRCRTRRITSGEEAARVRRWRKSNATAWQAQQARAVERQRQLGWPSSSRRRARVRGSFVEDIDRREVLGRFGGFCGICGSLVDPEDFHVDHIIPLARGGEHSYANVQPTHPDCNFKKGAKC